MSEKQYETETGEKATYRKGSSDYHTLRYVKWLQADNKRLKNCISLILSEIENRFSGINFEIIEQRFEQALKGGEK